MCQFTSGGGGCTPSQVQGGYPIQIQVGGLPHSRSAWGTPLIRGVPTRVTPPEVPPSRGAPEWGTPPPSRSSIVCTCYAAVGMPLAFTQVLTFLLSCSFQDKIGSVTHKRVVPPPLKLAHPLWEILDPLLISEGQK